MTALHIPTLAGIARMKPIMGNLSQSNVGANALTAVYQVPTGKLTILTHVTSGFFGGTAPTSLRAEIRDDDDAGTTRDFFVKATPAFQIRAEWTGLLFLGETDRLYMGILGGDGTTDVSHSVFGVEFDWIDVT